jgi:exopolysaccharide biosynthesis predicted pyruvyltransferase EpsI
LLTRMDFQARKALYKESLLHFLAQQSDLCLLTNIPGNIGDHLIWAGTEDLLAFGGIPYTSILLKDIQDIDLPRGTLLVPGSGALTKSYHEWLPAAVISASRRFYKVILLPSGYEVTVPIVAECLSQENVYAFARETRSYRSMKNMGRAALSFDCAVYYHEFDDVPALLPKNRQDTVLLALREDKDSLLCGQNLAPNPDINEDISRVKTSLDEWIKTIRRHDIIVTDRLHVAMASVLFGKRLFYLDPRNSKISNYFSFTFRDMFDDRFEHCTTAWLLSNDFVIEKLSV